ncbi:MAG: RluA family pseudouridine synthase [Clostridia bacterium]|nr:RluA family pseudouridine synthase [Clostridia bacterium]
MENREYEAGKEYSGMRIDKYLAELDSELTRSAVQKLIDDEMVTVNGKVPQKNMKLREGDRIILTVPEPVPPEALPENIPLDIVYEDDDLLVVNKPRGMVVHPAAGNPDGTLVNALLYHCGDSLSGINGILRPGIVHRIDKDTSGLLIVAKNDFSHRLLAEQIKEHSFTRKYQAVVCGNIKEDSGTVNAPIGRHPTDRKKMTVTLKNSREAVTHYRVITRYRGYTHVELTLETGRTHQIRVHMANMGHPVAGDPVYGGKNYLKKLDGQCLHAYYISFLHPRTNETLTLSAPLPQYFTDFLKTLEEI